MTDRPEISGMLETCVYVDDLSRASAFYEEVLGLELMTALDRLHAFSVGPRQVLLLFPRELSQHDSRTPFGLVPGHRADGPAHFAFRIGETTYEPWKAWLRRKNVDVTSEVTWPRGGRSLYFNDPDGNVLEMATPGLWPNYTKDEGADG